VTVQRGIAALRTAVGPVQLPACQASAIRSNFDTPPDPEGRLYCFWRDVAISQGSSLVEEMLALDGQCQLASNR
jgi:hypothetical protein